MSHDLIYNERRQKWIKMFIYFVVFSKLCQSFPLVLSAFFLSWMKNVSFFPFLRKYFLCRLDVCECAAEYGRSDSQRDTAGAGALGKKGPQKAVGRAPAIRSMLASFFAAPGLRIAPGPSTGT